MTAKEVKAIVGDGGGLELSVEDSRDLADGGLKGFRVMEDVIVDHSRWAVIHRIVVKQESTGRYYTQEYRVGATEAQDEQPFEYNDDPVVWARVAPVEKVTTVYEPIEPLEEDK